MRYVPLETELGGVSIANGLTANGKRKLAFCNLADVSEQRAAYFGARPHPAAQDSPVEPSRTIAETSKRLTSPAKQSGSGTLSVADNGESLMEIN
jgi:hypothetical protein